MPRSPVVPTLARAASAIVLTVVGMGLMFRNGETLIDGFNLVLVGGWRCLRARPGGCCACDVPNNRLGAVFLLTAVLWSAVFVLNDVREVRADHGPGRVPGGPADACGSPPWVWIPARRSSLFAMPMLFPDGHLPSSRWRPVAAVVVVGVVMSMLGHALAVWPLRDTLVPTAATNFMAADQPGLGGRARRRSATASCSWSRRPPPSRRSCMRYRRSTGVASGAAALADLRRSSWRRR